MCAKCCYTISHSNIFFQLGVILQRICLFLSVILFSSILVNVILPSVTLLKHIVLNVTLLSAMSFCLRTFMRSVFADCHSVECHHVLWHFKWLSFCWVSSWSFIHLFHSFILLVDVLPNGVLLIAIQLLVVAPWYLLLFHGFANIEPSNYVSSQRRFYDDVDVDDDAKTSFLQIFPTFFLPQKVLWGQSHKPFTSVNYNCSELRCLIHWMHATM
jgi:hypothetical protein